MALSLLERRTIEAAVLGPVVRAFEKEVGKERALEILTQANTEAAREYGRQLAEEMGSATIADLVQISRSWSPAGELEEELLEQTDRTFHFNVTRCRYAEEYERLGLRDLGTGISCCRDIGFIEGFNSKIRLVRTATVMEGHKRCDFRYTLKD